MPNKLGRPKGSINGSRNSIRRWEPKKWKVNHEMAVLLHVGGKSNKVIGEMLDKSEMWVSLVINTDKAKEVIEGIRKTLPHKDVADRYRGMLDKSVKRMEDYINNDDLAQSTPGAMFDRAARLAEMIDVRLKNVGGAGGGGSNNGNSSITNNVIFASEESVGRLLTALDRSSEVTKKHRTLGLIGGHSGDLESERKENVG